MRIESSELHGTVTAPPSKSHTHRSVFLASMAEGRSVIRAPLLSADIFSSCDALRAFGAMIDQNVDGSLTIEGGVLEAPEKMIDVGNSGTTLRLLTGLASLFPVTTTIDGDSSLRTRPMAPLLMALEKLGASCTSRDGRPPLSVRGPVLGNETSIDGGVSSQFISSLLMAGGLRDSRTRITVEGKLTSGPYVDITLSMMSRFGADVLREGATFITEGGGYTPCDYHVPGDFSSAAFPLVAGAICGDVRVEGLDHGDLQGDKAIIEILRSFGADVSTGDGWARSRKADLQAADVDLGDTPDLFPVVCVLAASSKGTSRLHNARHLRFKESDRIATSVAMLRALGADVTPTEDGCVVRGGGQLRGGSIETHGDHRIMMAGAIAAMNAHGTTVMRISGEHRVSYPQFIAQMRDLGGSLELDEDEQVWQ